MTKKQDLSEFREGHGGMGEVMAHLSDAVDHAELMVKEMQAAGLKGQRQRQLLAALRTLLERAEKLDEDMAGPIW